MGSGVAHEQKRHEKCEHGDDRESDDQHVPGGEVGRQPAADAGRDGDAAIPGRFVEPECKPAPTRADQVDLHDDRHRPREALVHAEQRVGCDDPGPARGNADEHRHRKD